MTTWTDSSPYLYMTEILADYDVHLDVHQILQWWFQIHEIIDTVVRWDEFAIWWSSLYPAFWLCVRVLITQHLSHPFHSWVSDCLCIWLPVMKIKKAIQFILCINKVRHYLPAILKAANLSVCSSPFFPSEVCCLCVLRSTWLSCTLL